jgi:hypothetical protein
VKNPLVVDHKVILYRYHVSRLTRISALMMRLLLVKDLLVVDQKTILYLYALTRMLLLFFVVKNSPVVSQKVILC